MDRDEKFIRLWQKGFQPRYIAKMLDMTEQHVYGRAQQLGLPGRGEPAPASPTRYSAEFWQQMSVGLTALRSEPDLTSVERKAARTMLSLARRKLQRG